MAGTRKKREQAPGVSSHQRLVKRMAYKSKVSWMIEILRKSHRILSGALAQWDMLANRLPSHLNMRAYDITKPGSNQASVQYNYMRSVLIPI
jgi:hypothetical protein